MTEPEPTMIVSFRRLLILPLCVAFLMLSQTAWAEPNTAASVYDDSGNYGDSQGYGRGRSLGYPGILADIILLRPTGLILTVGGTALFLATSPLIGIAAFAPPHDAFTRAGTLMVVGPAGFTFNRPLGEMNYQRDGVYPNLTRPQDRPISPPVPVVTRTVTTPATPLPPSR
jgi:hypothetical protein